MNMKKKKKKNVFEFQEITLYEHNSFGFHGWKIYNVYSKLDTSINFYKI